MPRSQDLERVRGELVEREAVACPVEHWERISEPGAPMVIYVQQPAPVVEPAREPRQRLAPWWLALMAVVAAVALLVWALNGPPVLQPIDHKHPNQHQGR